MKPLLTLAACGLLLAACGETDQAKTAGTTNRSDVAPAQGTKNGYAVSGWTAGNQGSWENHIRARGQLQNEYQKVN
ncbi:MAG TPA: hypothetical protein VIM12_03535 [Noviherbaspirillum sp.]|jgi:hypothetical protein|uniref:hypothetical protein n=1 Tax=Noviherbaspirillum sp. TaxID=1926288 RepID=UPI002F958B5C